MRTRTIRALALITTATTALALAGCQSGTESTDTEGDATVSLRLWDDQAAAAYEAAIPAFEDANPGITIDVEVVPWGDYWTTLRNDIASGTAPDIFWTNSNNFVDYVEAGALLNIDEALGADASDAWVSTVVDQFTVDGTLWGVPQLTDPGIGVFYNQDLLDAAGVTLEQVESLTWDPSGANDTLIDVASALTLDGAGNTPADAGFDPLTLTQFGYSAAYDFQAIWSAYLGSNGASFQDGDLLAFDSPEGIEATQYIVDLINTHHVAPSAADTNDNGDFNLQQFLQGNLALFQTGAYNLANISQGADFTWGIAPLPAGPEGAISVTNGIIAAGNAESEHPDAQQLVLEWLGSEEGGTALAAEGAVLPAVVSAQDAYFSYWEAQGVDVSPLIDVLENGTSDAPHGARIGDAFTAFGPILTEVFLGRLDVAEGLAQAQHAGNEAIEG